MNFFKNVLFAVALSLVSLSPAALAQTLRLPPIFADHAVLQRDKPITVHGYAKPSSQVSATFDHKTVAATADSAGRWDVTFPAHPLGGGPFTLKVTSDKEKVEIKDLLMGDVWIASGQSNMHFPMLGKPPFSEGVLNYETEIAAANYPKIRVFTVPEEASATPKAETEGTWQVVSPDTVCLVSAVAYYFATEVFRRTGIPIGIIFSAVGGTPIDAWMETSRIDPAELASDQAERDRHADAFAGYYAKLPAFYEAAHQVTYGCNAKFANAYITPPTPNWLNLGGGCYNAMIYPLRDVQIKGFIWYQGESDAKTSELYAGKMQKLIDNWRAIFHDPAAPFYYVQLANRDFRGPEAANPKFVEGRFGRVRYAQFDALAIPHTGMAVAADVGDPQNIHPRDKKTVGLRLAYQALRKTYGMTDVVADGPLYSSFDVKGKELILHFITNGSPMVNRTRSNEPDGFEIAGDNGKFYPAISLMKDDTVILTSPAVKVPVKARYAADDNPVLSLYNTAGLPTPTFETK